MHKVYLNEVFDPKHNSLNFIRLFLAILVVFSHSYELGGYGIDPLKIYCKITFGEFAVNSFFVISGFLITASFINSSSVWQYLWKRILRIFPGFWTCLLLTALVLCPIYWLQNGSFHHLGNNSFFNYVKNNFFLKINQPNIGNLFINNPAHEVINGSLWTLFPEFLCYLITGILGRLKLLTQPKKILILFCFLVIINAIVNTEITNIQGKLWYLFRLLDLFTYFLAGTLFDLYKNKILFSTKYFWGIIIIFVLCMMFGIYNLASPFLLPYILLGLAITLPFHKFDKYGDYSYGVYIYSYPIQQTVYFLHLNIYNQISFFLTSIIITFPLAWLSWNFVEKPSLKLKKIKREYITYLKLNYLRLTKK